MAKGDDETDDPNQADDRNFYKVETWSQDGLHITGMLWAGSSLGKAYSTFHDFARKRPRARLSIRQRTRLIAEWPTKK